MGGFNWKIKIKKAMQVFPHGPNQLKLSVYFAKVLNPPSGLCIQNPTQSKPKI